MGKRQQRIAGSDLKIKSSGMLNQECNLVLKDQSVLHGYVYAIEGEQIFVEDNRRHRHSVSLQEVTEVILEKVTPN
ncbi:MAG: hypothetical protein A3H98_03550 [Bacteroidetes bacterium RIFCSPLOWO2_02_FULL_36_8]|nr:MAG: hypothetical protein A3H98_03550 [Bacteroidetes bacterium RIFCSPLOWO2_02_FULL_36_8]OFY69517.1 MAG: hypothetical protein A3G23_10795 [Bacteroidetes bacterium RIFCSPLOWO2_12_FULL_37_12]